MAVAVAVAIILPSRGGVRCRSSAIAAGARVHCCTVFCTARSMLLSGAGAREHYHERDMETAMMYDVSLGKSDAYIIISMREV